MALRSACTKAVSRTLMTVRGYPDVPTLEEKEEALAKLVNL